MRTVLLLRHAKSDRAGFAGDDFDRPLNRRGVAAARQVGRLLQRINEVPQLVLCSAALRARTTLELAIQEGDWDTPVRHEQHLYLAGAQTMQRLLRNLPEQTESVMLVAHEPGLSELLGRLLGGGAHRMPTGALARVDLPVTRWTALAAGHGELQWLLPPRPLTAFAGGH